MALLRLMTVLLASLACASCAQTRLVRGDRGFVPPPVIGVAAHGNEGVRITLRHRIVPNGPGSWVRDAPWEEYAVSIENQGSSPVTLVDAVIAESNEVLVSNPSLEGAPAASAAGLMLAGASIAGYASVYVVPMTMAAAVTAVGVAAVLFPLAIVGAEYAEGKEADQRAIQKEVERLRIPFPQALAPAQSARGSLFFPIVPNARVLALRYDHAGVRSEIRLAIEAAAAMSRASTEQPAPAREETGVSIRILDTILPGGPGTWVPHAPWVEYRLVVRNDTDRPATVKSLTRQCRGLPGGIHMTSVPDLVAATLRNEDLYRRPTRESTRPPFEFEPGFDLTTLIANYFVPPDKQSPFHGSEKARRAVSFRIERTALFLPVEIPPRGEVEGSAFFAVSSGPAKIRAVLVQDGVDRNVDVVLPGVTLGPADERPRLIGGVEPGDLPREGEPLRHRVPAHIWMRVAADGRVPTVYVVEPENANALYDKAAAALAARWRFEPGAEGRVYDADVLLPLRR